ncbi:MULTISPECIES: enoyl-CoA hydratase/isomerase family protein [Frankia]|uniref:Enoyl-CoA hydratase/isomerase n=1 Tax=Frankia alni (strain DSM 45986 / CECT 9034 / ACN14a) TaxID=326424 RepID=Q0RGI0_FRAAA|nr:MULTISPECIES: enoyl-CoA hydratase-related protein [Frankia]CAJ63407.1 Putative enoyl-CoA hydratase/isomerase [Frankia alni ACN14a]
MYLNGDLYLRDTAAEGRTVLVTQPAPGVRVLTMNRPERLNALSAEMIRDLHHALDEVTADEACRVVVLTGAGRGFCAGLDLFSMPGKRAGEADASPQARLHTQQAIAALVPRLRNLAQPVIAAVNGPAAGGGFGLALAADIRVAATSARFNAAFVRIGLSGCDIGVSWLLPRLIGAGRSHELLLTGRLVDAAEAERLGLVSRVVPDGETLDAALEIAAQITANSPMGVWMTKEVAWSQLEVGSLQAGIDLENRTQIMTAFTRDHTEQISAFREKRPPTYTNG